MSSTPHCVDALAATTEELLLAIRLRFYTHRLADYHRHRQRLLYALTWPATWLDARGLTCSPQRYQTLIEERLQAIAAHGTPTTHPSSHVPPPLPPTPPPTGCPQSCGCPLGKAR